MRFVQLTAGAGDNFYCENCLRDVALVRAMRQAGHDAMTVPLYLPLMTGEGDGGGVFFGGINVYLQQKSGLFRWTPRWLDRLLDSPRLLHWAGKKAGMTSAREVGETLLSMLRGEQGRQAKEVARLAAWLRDEAHPDVVSISAALLIGAARRIRDETGAAIVCSLQDEEGYLDALGEPYRSQAWALLAERCRGVDAFIAPSRFYAETMQRRLGLPAEKVHVIHNAIDVHGYAPAEHRPEPPTVGFLQQLSAGKGFDTLVEAFILLKRTPELAAARLRALGGVTGADAPTIQAVTRRLKDAGVWGDVELITDFLAHDKAAFLRTCSAVSVPTRRGEAFGLWLLESLAGGVPVVVPDHGANRELVDATGGGLLCRPNDPPDLADKLHRVLTDRHLADSLGRHGRAAVLEKFTTDRMAAAVTRMCEGLAGPARGGGPVARVSLA
jgi:glycosyltransferase involved in cell wall biosynthesis